MPCSSSRRSSHCGVVDKAIFLIHQIHNDYLLPDSLPSGAAINRKRLDIGQGRSVRNVEEGSPLGSLNSPHLQLPMDVEGGSRVGGGYGGKGTGGNDGRFRFLCLQGLRPAETGFDA